jgi:hypothetical protein
MRNAHPPWAIQAVLKLHAMELYSENSSSIPKNNLR